MSEPELWTRCPDCEGRKYYDGPSEMCGCWMVVYEVGEPWGCLQHRCRACFGTGLVRVPFDEAVQRMAREFGGAHAYWEMVLRAALGEGT